MSNEKEINQFETLISKSDRIGPGAWRLTTSKRQTVIPPKGVRIWDTDMSKEFIGDGATAGGVCDNARNGIRKVAIDAAASGGLSASATTDKFTWTTKGAYLRTGDGVTLAAGTGTVPSGTSATTYFVIKDDDCGNSAGDTSTSFKIASTRANAIARTAVDILSSGAAGYTMVISDIVVQPGDEIVHLDPVGAACDVVLPDAHTAATDGFRVVVKKDTGAFAVTVKELDVSGNVSGGIDNLDGSSGTETLYANFADSIEFYSTNDEWFTLHRRVSGA